jgi:hypothetical protein
MTTSDECTAHAERCKRLAAEASNLADKAYFLDAAEDWRMLAIERSDLRPRLFMTVRRS